MDRVGVISTNLASVGYDAETRMLEVAFHNGTIYAYFDVPQAVYDKLLSAQSKGQYFNRLIRDQYDYRQLK